MESPPNNNKNLILAVALSLMVLIGWQVFFPPTAPVVQQTAQAPANSGVNNGQVNPQNQTNNNPVIADSTTAPVTTGAQNQSSANVATFGDDISGNLVSRQAALQKDPRIIINTARVNGSINLNGGRIDDLTLLDYRETLDDDADYVHLLNPKDGKNPYYADFGWLGDNQFTPPTQRTLWQSYDRQLNANGQVTLFWDSPENIRFEKIFTIDEDFMMSMTQRIVNNSGNNIAMRTYGLVARTGLPETENFYILHEGFLAVLNDELIEEDYDDTDDGPIKFEQRSGWLGITDKYWLAALVPQQESFNGSFKNGGKDRPIFQADFYTNVTNVPNGAAHQDRTLLFAGAKEVKLLDKYEANYGIKSFDLGVDFGVLYFITKPLFLVIDKLFDIFGNFGVAIIALTFMIKLLFFPLAQKSYTSISKMKQLQPEMQELRERYGEDKQRLQQEMMKMYRERKINPMAGCVPIILQIPVFFALYKVLFVTIEMRHAPFFGWIQDLSAPDPLGILTLFGLIPWTVPAILTFVNIGIWPIIMGLTMWIQQKLNPAPPDPMQQKIFAMLPFVFTFLLATFPAGLVIYWTLNNTLTILQQWTIMRSLERKQRNNT